MKEYEELFAQRKWKKALAAMPLNIPKVVVVNSANELNTLRVRAYEYAREADKSVSVSLDYDNRQAVIKITKKEQ